MLKGMSLLFVISLSMNTVAAGRVDGFGKMPDGIDAKEFVAWIAPGNDSDIPDFVETKAIGENRFVAMACFGGSAEEFDEASDSSGGEWGDGKCAKEPGACECDNGAEAWFGVFSVKGKNWTPIARLEEPIELDENEDQGSDQPEGIVDFGKTYSLNGGQLFFDVKTNRFATFASGGERYDDLILYMIDGKKILPVFQDEIYCAETYSAASAGAIHANSESQGSLHILKTKTAGFHNLLLKYKVSPVLDGDIAVEKDLSCPVGKIRYEWSVKAKKYLRK
jgi:hypothetical protein